MKKNGDQFNRKYAVAQDRLGFRNGDRAAEYFFKPKS